MKKNIALSVMLLTSLAVAAELSEAEVDRLCPPRAETAAEFKAGTYPPAARPYREAALKTFAYMASLPAMRTLVEKGEPEQTYQHNAYVSKTHAAHINLMLEWARREPARRTEAMRFAKASAEYLLTQLEPKDAPLAGWPPTYGRKPLRRDPSDGGKNRPAMVGNEPEGAVKYRGEVMLLYPADVGAAFVAYYRETHDSRFLDAARGIGETYLKTRRSDGSWPLKMRLATGEPIGGNTLVPTKPMAFFRALAEATGDDRWAKASDACFAWLEAHPLTDWNWDGQFEDIQPRPPYANPTKHNAVDAMFEILRRFPGDKARLEQCRRILRFCERRFVCWEKPANHPQWDVPSVLEQYSCFIPIDASAAKMIRAYLALWRATGEPELLAKARTLGDTITRVQTPEGRIPTFWTHDTLGQPIYDWLNCMGSSAAALLELDDAKGAACAFAAEVKVDFATETGPVKPVNGVGQPPMLGFGNDRLFHYLTEAGIPFSRLHDTGGAFGKNVYVDIPNIFRDFDADENDPKSYDFAFTDDLMAKLDKAGVRPYFRLGVTIENGAARRAYRIFPPKDYAKWARICEHVMAHYVEGWANGPRVKVSHWEIWNEADFHPQERLNQMWQGPFEEFIRLYVTAATHLKARFPQEKIGGFGSCGFYHAATGDARDQAIHHMKCIEAFFAAVKRAHAPLDFFSYHSYAGVEATMKHARVAREYADKYGFAGIELSLNEWLPNPRHEKLGSAQQAAEIAAEMIGFQNGPVDSACIYDARCGIGNYSPLFNVLTYKPHKAYWAFVAFNELRKAGTAVKATSSDPHVWAAAAKGAADRIVMVANDGDREVPLALDLGGGVPSACRIVDDTRTWENIPIPAALPPYSILLVSL